MAVFAILLGYGVVREFIGWAPAAFLVLVVFGVLAVASGEVEVPEIPEPTRNPIGFRFEPPSE